MNVFDTSRQESFRTRMRRWQFNFFPAYRRTGARITFISGDWKEVHVKLPLNWKTRNYVGSVFGGSIFGALDPIYMIQLLQLLGKDYVVWDKSASIRFIRPVKQTIYARFLIEEHLLEQIRRKVKDEQSYEVELSVDFQDQEGTVYASSSKLIYIADKEYYRHRKSSQKQD